jgi:hypothetical protein
VISTRHWWKGFVVALPPIPTKGCVKSLVGICERQYGRRTVPGSTLGWVQVSGREVFLVSLFCIILCVAWFILNHKEG